MWVLRMACPLPTIAGMSGRPTRSTSLCPLLAAGVLLLAVIVPGRALAAPGDANRLVPTKIYDRALAEGEVRVLVELALPSGRFAERSEEHTSELQSQSNLVCRLLLEKK